MNNNKKPKDYDKWYRDEFKKPLEEIKQDIFFRADNFQHEDMSELNKRKEEITWR